MTRLLLPVIVVLTIINPVFCVAQAEEEPPPPFFITSFTLLTWTSRMEVDPLNKNDVFHKDERYQIEWVMDEKPEQIELWTFFDATQDHHDMIKDFNDMITDPRRDRAKELRKTLTVRDGVAYSKTSNPLTPLQVSEGYWLRIGSPYQTMDPLREWSFVGVEMKTDDMGVKIAGSQIARLTPIAGEASSSMAMTSVDFQVNVREASTVYITGCNVFETVFFENESNFQQTGDKCSFRVPEDKINRIDPVEDPELNDAAFKELLQDPHFKEIFSDPNLKELLKDLPKEAQPISPIRYGGHLLKFSTGLELRANVRLGQNTGGKVENRPFRITIVSDGNVHFFYKGVPVLVDRSCKPDLGAWRTPIKKAIDAAIGPRCIGPSPLKRKLTHALKNKGVQISCGPYPGVCGDAIPGGSKIRIAHSTFSKWSPCTESGTIFHEILHAHGGEEGTENHDEDRTVIKALKDYETDIVYGCEQACFPTEGSRWKKEACP